ncbi:unnamed protein product [Mesocestoides corti]|uniref:Uncharacterized protein n=1 Tax=Mesocestoides corti TaxID=53468 RepID=A0A0R3UNB3_MESCO|nr:unnamed protein product [Mesocestoides corti]
MALWDKLPPLNEQAHKFQPVDKLKGTLSKKALDAFAPRHKHVQDPRMKQAIVIMDKMITKVMLVCAFPNIVDEMQHYKLLLGRDLTEKFVEYDKLARQYDRCGIVNASRNPATWSTETLKSICQGKQVSPSTLMIDLFGP